MIGVFESERALLAATRAARDGGFRIVDAFTPYAVHGLDRAMGLKPSRLTWACFLCGAAGAFLAWAFQHWTSAVDWPINVGGKPWNSLPAFIPVTFELTILFSAFSAVIGMFVLNGLPAPYHPVFNVEAFERASVDRFFLVIESEDPNFDQERTREFLAGLGSREVYDVDW